MPKAIRAVRKGGSSCFRRMRCVRSHGSGAFRPGFHGSDPFRFGPVRARFAPVAESRWSSSRSRPVSRPLAAGGASVVLADVCRRAPILMRLARPCWRLPIRSLCSIPPACPIDSPETLLVTAFPHLFCKNMQNLEYYVMFTLAWRIRCRFGIHPLDFDAPFAAGGGTLTSAEAAFRPPDA